MVTSFIRIYGPPILKAIKALEAVAVEMSKAVDVRFSHKCVPYPRYLGSETRDWEQYIQNMKKTYVDCYEPVRIISRSKEMLGDYDFFFEWSEEPTIEQVENLIEKIDEALGSIGCNYTITTK